MKRIIILLLSSLFLIQMGCITHTNNIMGKWKIVSLRSNLEEIPGLLSKRDWEKITHDIIKNTEFNFNSNTTLLYKSSEMGFPKKLVSHHGVYSLVDSIITIQLEENMGTEKYLITKISNSEIQLAQHSMCNGSFFYTLAREK